MTVVWAREKAGKKPKRVKDYAYHKEKMMMCKQAEQGVPLQAEQADWLEDTDEEIDEQELEAHYSYMAKILEVSPEESRFYWSAIGTGSKNMMKKDDSNVTPDSSNICTNDNQVDQNAAECVDERAALANLIANLTLDTEENKTILKQLKKANASLTQELEKCKTNLDETNSALRGLLVVRDSCLIALQNKTVWFDKYKALMIGDDYEIFKQRKSVETQFDKPSVVRQPNAQRIPKPSVLGKPTPFSNSPEMRSFQTKQSVNKTNVSDGLFKQVTQQNLPQNRKQAEIHSNVLKPGMYRIATTTTQNREPQLPHASRNTNPHVSKSSGVNHTTSVSRPQLKCYQVKDKVVPNNSQVKFKKNEVEDHYMISSISKKTKSITACNDSSNSRTLKVNAVCAECGKCVFNSNHDACVSRYLNDVNARTKKPNVVPISASKHKRKANKSVATPHKKTIVQLILFIVDSGCTKHMTGNLKLLCNFVEKFLGTVHFGNDQFALILGYGDLIQGNVTIKRVYYVEGLNHNLFSVGQFCDADLEVAFRKSTCFVRDLQGNDLLTGSRGSDLYTISLQETTSSTPICFMAKASPTQAWLWHRRLSHLNFDYITLLSKKEAARMMLSASKLSISFWAEAVATACYTQNRSIIISTHGKTAYHLINDRKPLIKHLYIFGCISYITRDGENLDKIKEKGSIVYGGIFYSVERGYRVTTRRNKIDS
ncbi:retrovirus-related pol polyprotein from transposon TNT 1-94 [Tanacetum coccineum]